MNTFSGSVQKQLVIGSDKFVNEPAQIKVGQTKQLSLQIELVKKSFKTMYFYPVHMQWNWIETNVTAVMLDHRQSMHVSCLTFGLTDFDINQTKAESASHDLTDWFYFAHCWCTYGYKILKLGSPAPPTPHCKTIKVKERGKYFKTNLRCFQTSLRQIGHF